MTKPTAERVRELFDYDPETGILTNRIGRAKAKAGSPAGSLRKDGYLCVSIDCCIGLLVHRVIWLWVTGEWPAHQVDHDDLNRSNNKWNNLREATAAQNGANRPVSKKNGSGVKGAFFHPQTGKYRARIQYQGKQRSLGLYDTAAMAGAAYLAAARTIHGEYARGSVQ
jgi:hypothetical protein